MDIPKITFGMIVLNGEPFVHYNLLALYPFAHEIIVVEGASPNAAHIATPDGHSVDTTLATLRRFKDNHDPENKLTIVTAEQDGYPNGFWPGEKDEQSQAYARRATGDWLWQIDVDEFYRPEDMQAVAAYLAKHPDITSLTFCAYNFWGGFDYMLEGGLFMSHRFTGELHGAIRRVLKWGEGYKYVTHRPPTVHDSNGRNTTNLRKVNASTICGNGQGYLYHYTSVFPNQVIPKGVYYANLGSNVGKVQRRKFESFMHPLTLGRGITIYNHYGSYNWLRRYSGEHPPVIRELQQDIAQGHISIPLRDNHDIEKLLHSPEYAAITAVLLPLERIRTRLWLIYDRITIPIKRALKRLFIADRAKQTEPQV